MPARDLVWASIPQIDPWTKNPNSYDTPGVVNLLSDQIPPEKSAGQRAIKYLT